MQTNEGWSLSGALPSVCKWLSLEACSGLAFCTSRYMYREVPITIQPLISRGVRWVVNEEKLSDAHRLATDTNRAKGTGGNQPGPAGSGLPTLRRLPRDVVCRRGDTSIFHRSVDWAARRSNDASGEKHKLRAWREGEASWAWVNFWEMMVKERWRCLPTSEGSIWCTGHAMDSSILFVLQSTIHVASDWYQARLSSSLLVFRRALSSSLWTSLCWRIEVVDALS